MRFVRSSKRVFALLFVPRSAGDRTGRSPPRAEPSRARLARPCAALAPLPVTWLLARLSAAAEQGWGGVGSVPASHLPPSEATKLLSVPPPLFFFFEMSFHVLPFNTPPGQKSSPRPSLLAFPSAPPPPATWQRGNFVTPEQPFLGLSLSFPSTPPPGEPPRGRRKLRPRTFRSRAASESRDFKGCICILP